MSAEDSTRCEHDWQRAPERDVIYGAFPVRRYKMVFWCRHCAAVKATEVTFEDKS